MDNNILNNAPFWSSFIAMLCAQALKPFISLFSGEGWKPKLVISNGGMPSSHTGRTHYPSGLLGNANWHRTWMHYHIMVL